MCLSFIILLSSKQETKSNICMGNEQTKQAQTPIIPDKQQDKIPEFMLPGIRKFPPETMTNTRNQAQPKIAESRYSGTETILKMTLEQNLDHNVNSLVQSRLKTLPASESRASLGLNHGFNEEEDYNSSLKAKFVGEKLNGKPHGVGKLYFQNGDYLEGTFVDGRCEGEGRIIKSDGSYYEGHIKNNQADGHGKFYDVNGYKYEGQWKNNLPNGIGEASYQQDGSRYIGQFLNNKKNGSGMLIINGDIFEGQFKNDKIDGFCKFVSQIGQTYQGQWIKGAKNGKGIYTWPDGKKYDGQYKNDQRHGYGIMYYSAEQKYSGQWENGQKHGQGTYESTKQKTNGVWVKGTLTKVLP